MAQENKKEEDWMQKKWRPAMGWMYMIVCMMDMVVFPVVWSLAQVLTKQPITQWNPLTLQGAGLFHLAMGAVLGIAAFGRTQEKVAGAASNATTITPPAASTFPVGMSTTSSVSAPVFAAPTFNSPAAPNTFGSGFPGDPDPGPRQDRLPARQGPAHGLKGLLQSFIRNPGDPGEIHRFSSRFPEGRYSRGLPF